MHLRYLSRVVLCAAVLSVFAANASAQATQAPAKPFEPQVGQAGKDVVWVPTPQALVDKMLDMAKVTPQDYLIDLGSGDGRTVITAAKRGLRAHGIEYNPDMVELAKRNAAAAGVDRQGHVREGRPVRERLLEGAGHHDVPAAVDQHEAAADHPEHEARHAHRVEHVHDGRLGARSGRNDRRSARAGARRNLWIVPAKVDGHLAAAAGRADLDPEVPDGLRHARQHADLRRASCAATRSPSRWAPPSTPAACRAPRSAAP